MTESKPYDIGKKEDMIRWFDYMENSLRSDSNVKGKAYALQAFVKLKEFCLTDLKTLIDGYKRQFELKNEKISKLETELKQCNDIINALREKRDAPGGAVVDFSKIDHPDKFAELIRSISNKIGNPLKEFEFELHGPWRKE